MSDDQVLEKSGLSQRGNMGLLKDIWIVGNSGYPLMDWVLVRYKFESESDRRVHPCRILAHANYV